MLGLLKRREVEILLEAGHRRTEVARLTGISPSSVGRIAGKASIEHFNDTAERRKRRIGRPSIVEGFRKMISDILEKEAELPSLEILRQVRKAGYSGGKTALYTLVASLRSMPRATKRNEAFEWMSDIRGSQSSGRSHFLPPITLYKRPPGLAPGGCLRSRLLAEIRRERWWKRRLTATIDSKVGESFGDPKKSAKLRKQSAFAESASSRYDGILSRILKGLAFGSLAPKEECLGVSAVSADLK